MAKSTKKTRKPKAAKKTSSAKKTPKAKTTAKAKSFSIMSFVLKWGIVSAIWGFVVVAALGTWLFWELPGLTRALDDHAEQDQASITILAYDQTQIGRAGPRRVELIPLSEMSVYIPMAVVAIEDRRFYDHWGVDAWAIGRAMVRNIQAGRVVQGGSTLTQQLAKNLFLTPERTLWRKAQEALLALYLEVKYDKNEILTGYLNRVYFGQGAYGIEAAAKTYFKKSARQLTLGEAAMLAGILKAPSRLNPVANSDLALDRMSIVLDTMVELELITEQDHIEALNLSFHPTVKRYAHGETRYFRDWVLGEMARLAPTKDGRFERITLKTTHDPKIQAHVDALVQDYMASHGENRRLSQIAVVVMRPRGDVLAMTGGVDYGTSQFNRAAQAKRQPGSAMKPFIYLAGLEHGYSPLSQVLDAPVTFGQNDDVYDPKNYDEAYHGWVTFEQALAQSMNVAAVAVKDAIHPLAVQRLVTRLGLLDMDLPAGDLSIALGSPVVDLLSLTGAYASFANNGQAVMPFGIISVDGYATSQSKSQPLYETFMVETPQLIDPKHLAEMNTMLRAVTSYGTGRGAYIHGALPWVAGKTGTSQGFRDAWFIGFSERFVVGVWMGHDNSSETMKGVTGGSLPVQLWGEIMRGLPTDRYAPVLAITPEPLMRRAEVIEDDTALDLLVEDAETLPSFVRDENDEENASGSFFE